ncbi:hypothetical protein [Halomonas sp. H5]|uniref:hypothetical protein n=1 Tax=Halomonas sp. H5 TaxID=3423910 RepID=UPI003D36D505
MNRYHHAMMFACLAVMGGAMLLLISRSDAPGNGAWLLLPMVLCLGAHLLLHRHGPHGAARGESPESPNKRH